MVHMRFPRIFISTLVTFLCVVVAPSVGAVSTAANASEGMEISPTLVELNAAPGNTYQIRISLRNITASDLQYGTSVADFNSADETGSPHIISDSTLPATSSIKTWVSTIPNFSLQSRQAKDLTALVTVPVNAEPGGHYGVLRFTGDSPELRNTNVGLTASAGVLILIRVSGAINEKASLAEFYSSQNDKQSSFFENGPITFVVRVQNAGNIHIKPSGSIELRDMFGGLVSTMPVNEDKSNILPNSIRRFETKLNKDWMFGKYTASLALGYGTSGQAITSTVTFWVIPYKIILVAILILITLIYILIRLIKVYNKHIIAKAKNEKTTKNKNDFEKKPKEKF